jgi:Tfp pilus assembly protein PilV
MRRAFTLIEVNLAIMVMAMGVLGLISLYSLGYRESQQSNEDVEASALAERNMNALVTMLSDTNMTWTAWNSIGTLPSGGRDNSGWASYYDFDNGTARSNPSARAASVFDTVRGKCSGCEGSGASFYTGNLECGLVVRQDRGRCAISFRAARRAGSMVFQPIYFTEVYFQGDPSK